MATEWEGKSKGTVLGYKIFIFFLKNFGIGASYFLLYFVAFYYCFFSGDNARAIYYYFRQRKGYSIFKSLLSVYQNHFVFGQTIIDKVAISSGLRKRFTYEFDGIEKIKALLAKKQGGIMISAHVGNFETAGHFFEDFDSGSLISLVTTDAEHAHIKTYLERVTSKSKIKFILVKEDMSHIFDIKNALDKGELVCFTGDRYFEGQKTLKAPFLGKEAAFPAGPFLLGSRLNVPVLFVYVMKETRQHYHLFARTAQVKNRNAQDLLENYTGSVAWILEKYPLQWFNYFNFWKTNENE